MRPEATLTIVSGGQTGVDRGALEAALASRLTVDGWCPKGRRAEDGAIPDRFPLRETASPDYAVRTAWNVRDSDGTLLLAFGPLCGGSKLTAERARAEGRPLLVIDAAGLQPGDALEAVAGFIEEHQIGRLNVAGPRESEAPGATTWARALVTALANRTEEDMTT